MNTGTINREKHPLSTDGPSAIDLAPKHPIATRKSRSTAQRSGARRTTDEAAQTERDPQADVAYEQESGKAAAPEHTSARAETRQRPIRPDSARATDELDEEQAPGGTHRTSRTSRSSTSAPRQEYRFQPNRSYHSYDFGERGRWSGLWEIDAHDIARLLGKVLLMAAGGLFLLYCLLFLCLSLCIQAQNHWSYGPTHTAYLHTTLNGQDTTIATATIENTIYVTIYRPQRDGSIQASTYTAALDSHGWDGTLSDYIATAAVSQARGATHGTTITVSVMGNVSCLHLFARPHATFHLIPTQRGGYHLALS